MILSRLEIFTKIFLISSLFIFSFAFGANAQNEDKVEVIQTVLENDSTGKCEKFVPGKVILFLKPLYPDAAKKNAVGGTVLVNVKIDKQGKIAEIVEISGDSLLQKTANEAARKTRFKPSFCDETPVEIAAVFSYDFVLDIFRTNLIKPEKVEDFADLSETSVYFETIRNLTEKYKIAYGFGTNKFYENAPLTVGDFAHFLRLTLDLLAERLKAAGKTPDQTDIFSAYNPHKISSAANIKKLNNNEFYADSVKSLFQNYKIAFVDDEKRFSGEKLLKQNELLDLWQEIFGAETVPVHFQKIEHADKIITRGEFALFLDESLRVLTYKVMP